MVTKLKRARPMPAKSVVKAAGGPGAVGAACGVTSQAVSLWKWIPTQHCCVLATLCDHTPEEMRPDAFWPDRSSFVRHRGDKEVA